MSIISDVLCDCCKKEISQTDLAYEYYLTLTPTKKVNTSGFSYAMGFSPEINGRKDFCGIRCLNEWIQTKHNLKPRDEK